VYCREFSIRNYSTYGDVRVITSVSCRLLKPFALLVGGALLSGCSGEENIPLKKVDFIQAPPPKDYKESRKGFGTRGLSSQIGHDPSGVNRTGSQ
jgi:hypothetical protein